MGNNNTSLIILIVLLFIISLSSLAVTLFYISAPIQLTLPQTTGKISVSVVDNSPVITEGKIIVSVVPKNEGGNE